MKGYFFYGETVGKRYKLVAVAQKQSTPLWAGASGSVTRQSPKGSREL